MRTDVDPPVPPRQTAAILRRCLGYLRPYARLTIGIYAAMIVFNTVTILTPQFIRSIIDRGIYGGDLGFLNVAVLGLLGLTIVKGVVVYLQGGWTEVASQHVAYDLRNEIQQKLNHLSIAFHDRTESGQILSRAIQDVERIRFLTGRAILRIVEGVVLLLGTAVVLIWMNPGLGLLGLLALPLLLHRAYVYGRLFRPLSIKIQDQLGVLTTVIEQNLRGAQVVKGFAQEEAEIGRFQQENDAWFRLSARAARIQSLNAPALDAIASLSVVFILWYGGALVAADRLTVGELVAFITYMGQLVRPIQLIGRIVPVLAIAASSGERIFGVLDAHSAVRDAPDAQPLPPIRGAVTFSGVSFAYQPGHDVIREVSFHVEPGQIVALLGATGAGKSTIINMLPRFYDPTNGRIAIDGIDTQQVTLRSLRAQIGIVLQDTWLFAATIRDNITFGRPQATDAEVEAAARDAQAHDFIMAMPDGYQTVIGERGITLSGGQKQRVAIARTLLTDPRILILDDATSSVDTNTERLIQQALARLMAGRTAFVIAHRLSTIRKAHLILLLDQGRIVARGTHAALLQSSPHYARLYEMQLRPQERPFSEVG